MSKKTSSTSNESSIKDMLLGHLNKKVFGTRAIKVYRAAGIDINN